MKKTCEILLLTTLIVLLVGVVSATDVSEDTTTTTTISDTIEAVQDTQTVSQTETLAQEVKTDNQMSDKCQDITLNESTTKNINKKKLQETNVKGEPEYASTWDDISSIVSSARKNTTIILNNTETYENTGTIHLSKNIVITIDGQGNTIDGNQKQVFEIEFPASLVLKNITITNANSSKGAIYSYGGTVNIINTTLSNNNARDTASFDGGGAINNYRGIVNITNSTLNNNTATAISLHEGGGAIYNYNGTLIITNTTLNNNHVTGTNNIDSGGVINNYRGTVNITNSTLNNNTATQGGTIFNYGGTVNIAHSTLNNNTATRGGAIYNINNGIITITYNTNIYCNHATGTNNYDGGGAIYNINNGTLTITDNTNIYNNTATRYGGAIYNINNGTLTITDNTNIYNNTATQGGSIYNYEGRLNITSTTLSNNTATDGGAIYNYEGTVNITNSTLNNNTATRYGGAIYNQEGILVIKYNAMLNNTARYGGAIYNVGRYGGNAFYNVSSSDFTENHASRGAAIYCENSYINSNITFNNFTRNTADNNETLCLSLTESVKNNTYNSTDISLATNNLIVDREVFHYGEKIELDINIELTSSTNYDMDIMEKLNKTLYINNTENITTNSAKYTLSNLNVGEYTAYYTTCNQESNKVYFKVIDNSKITTDKETYDYYEGINNKITLNITDESKEKGTIFVNVKDGEEYTQLFSYFNMEDKSTISTEALKETLENIYTNLNKSYTIKLTYTSNSAYINQSSIEFTFNMIKEINKTCIITIDTIPDIKFNDNLTIYGKLINTHGIGIKGQKVTVKINGADNTVTTDTNGVWKLKIKTLTLGTNNITATYNGTTYNTYTTSTTFEITQTEAIITIDKIATTQFRDNVTITGTFKNSNGKAIANSKVRVNVNGYSTYVTTDHDGAWSLTLKTNKTGVNNVTASFTGNANYAKYTTNTTFNVTKQDLIITTEVKYNKGNFTITGTFIDKNGNKLANSKIRVNINGKAIYVKTDSNGTYTYSEMITAKTIKYNVYYGGSANYNSYTSSKTTLTVA